MTCTFQRAWQGTCGKPTADGYRCDEHKDLLCASCGAPATSTCDETQGPCVCGNPLCENCEHALAPDGTNRGSDHIRKGTQRYKPWYVQNEEEKLQGDYLMLKRRLDSIEWIAQAVSGEKGETYRNETRPAILKKIAEMEDSHPELFGLMEAPRD